jgi:hypothetical protein
MSTLIQKILFEGIILIYSRIIGHNRLMPIRRMLWEYQQHSKIAIERF